MQIVEPFHPCVPLVHQETKFRMQRRCLSDTEFVAQLPLQPIDAASCPPKAHLQIPNGCTQKATHPRRARSHDKFTAALVDTHLNDVAFPALASLLAVHTQYVTG